MNIEHGGRFFNGDALADVGTLPAAIQAFIASIRQDSVLRWGGDFDDPVHIDDGLNLREPSVWDQKFPRIQQDLNDLTEASARPDEPRLLFLRQPPMRGGDVTEIQLKLIDLGFKIAADGIFGPATDDAITAFQVREHLTADGVVGGRTRAALGL
jgi:murein L,D-transpeptidase YcbB/YkuD